MMITTVRDRGEECDPAGYTWRQQWSGVAKVRASAREMTVRSRAAFCRMRRRLREHAPAANRVAANAESVRSENDPATTAKSC
jgi:hypothetical protein